MHRESIKPVSSLNARCSLVDSFRSVVCFSYLHARPRSPFLPLLYPALIGATARVFDVSSRQQGNKRVKQIGTILHVSCSCSVTVLSGCCLRKYSWPSEATYFIGRSIEPRRKASNYLCHFTKYHAVSTPHDIRDDSKQQNTWKLQPYQQTGTWVWDGT